MKRPLKSVCVWWEEPAVACTCQELKRCCRAHGTLQQEGHKEGFISHSAAFIEHLLCARQFQVLLSKKSSLVELLRETENKLKEKQEKNME